MNERTTITINTTMLRRVAEATGTPTVAYDVATIEERCGVFRAAISGIPSRLLFAMKANSNPAILRLMTGFVDGVDAVSPGEVELALRVGFGRKSILFSPNNMTDSEMAEVRETGVLMNIGELSRLEKFGEAYPGSEVCVRLNLWVGAGHHRFVVTGGDRSKFGIPGEKLGEIVRIAAQYELTIVGLHQHIGSGFSSADDFANAVELLIEAARRFPELQFLNVGGGIGIPYRTDDRPFDLDGVGKHIKMLHANIGRDISFWFEPGRYLIAESGTLLVTATALKQLGQRTFAGTDSGFNHLIRPMLYDAYHEIVNLSNPDGVARKYDIAGNICESGDLFATERMVAEIREGDVLGIQDVGAYGLSMGSEYNMRPFPEEVLVDADGTITTIRPRLSTSALVDRYISETTGN